MLKQLLMIVRSYLILILQVTDNMLVSCRDKATTDCSNNAWYNNMKRNSSLDNERRLGKSLDLCSCLLFYKKKFDIKAKSDLV